MALKAGGERPLDLAGKKAGAGRAGTAGRDWRPVNSWRRASKSTGA